MSILVILLVAIILYLIYVMLQSYRSLERELREIRVKCTGRPSSKYADADPAVTVQNSIVGALKALTPKE